MVELEDRTFPAEDRFPARVWRHLLGPGLRRRTVIPLAARAGGRVVGAAIGLTRANSRVLRVYSIAVDASARGQGLGQRLLRALVAAAPPRCEVVSLEVRSTNAAARALYERAGMRPVATLPGYYAPGSDGVRYRAPRSAWPRRA